MVPALLLAALPFAAAFPHSASSFAGATTSDIFPPPGATSTAYDTYFPDAEEVGFAGPTPSMCLTRQFHVFGPQRRVHSRC